MLIGALGAAIPIILHLIGRRKAQTIDFAAVDFLLGSDKKLARNLRLREWLLLVARTLVCIAIPLALAKPYTSCEASGPLVERGPQAAVIVMDNSFATGYQLDGATLLSRERDQARSILERLGPEAEAAVVMTSTNALPPSELTRDHLRVRDSIDSAMPTAFPGNTTVALERAAQLLATSSHESKTIYLISPLFESAFRPSPPWPPGTGPALRVIDITEHSRLDNLAVVSVDVEPDVDSGTRGVRVVAQIENFGAAAVTDHPISLRIANRIVARGVISARPGERVVKPFSATLPEGARVAELAVILDDDALPIDNRFNVLAELREETRVLLVNGDPRTVRHEDELFYLEAALRPGDRGDSGVSIEIATLDRIRDIDLEQFDVIVLANTNVLPRKQVQRVAAWIRGGGGLLISVGDNVDPDLYNKRMRPLLPQELQTARDVVYGKRGSERSGRALRLTKLETSHPVFSIFPADSHGLGDATFSKIMLLGPTTRVDARRVLARYDSGAIAIVERTIGDGRVLFFTSSLDRDWTELPIHPGYLPFVQQAVRYLGRKSQGRRDAALHVGGSVVIQVVPEDARIEVRKPRGSPAILEGEALEDRNTVTFSDTDYPGFYQVVATDGAGREVARRESDFAVNVDTRYSNLTRIALEELPLGRSSSDPDTIASATHERRMELWHVIAVALLGLLLIESLLALRR